MKVFVGIGALFVYFFLQNILFYAILLMDIFYVTFAGERLVLICRLTIFFIGFTNTC
jgi:hypothetical protein